MLHAGSATTQGTAGDLNRLAGASTNTLGPGGSAGNSTVTSAMPSRLNTMNNFPSNLKVGSAAGPLPASMFAAKR